jgi:hypothetical protein
VERSHIGAGYFGSHQVKQAPVQKPPGALNQITWQDRGQERQTSGAGTARQRPNPAGARSAPAFCLIGLKSMEIPIYKENNQCSITLL